ncbi:MAG: hypothetical protein IKR39_08605 [Lachnospiraceae bacterium]|nr:hypothetical protein [Lachnospiraceae bacterium]
MTQKEQIETALNHVINIAMGLDPLTGDETEEGSILNRPEVIRTMFTVKEVLQEKLTFEALSPQHTQNMQFVAPTQTTATTPKKPRDTRPIGFPPEIVDNFKFKGKTTVTHFIKDMYACAETDEFKPVKAATILNWLVLEGYLEEAYDKDLEVNYKSVTEKGKELGLSNRRVESGLGGRSYISVMFGKEAQEYVVNNMEKILNGEAA